MKLQQREISPVAGEPPTRDFSLNKLDVTQMNPRGKLWSTLIICLFPKKMSNLHDSASTLPPYVTVSPAGWAFVSWFAISKLWKRPSTNIHPRARDKRISNIKFVITDTRLELSPAWVGCTRVISLVSMVACSESEDTLNIVSPNSTNSAQYVVVTSIRSNAIPYKYPQLLCNIWVLSR